MTESQDRPSPPLIHMLIGQRELAGIESFRSHVESMVGRRLGLRQPERHDRDDHWIMATRWPFDAHWWLEMSIRPTMPQVCVGVLTDDRDRSRDAEKMIAGSSMTPREFVGVAFTEAGLDWPEPVVEHYRERAGDEGATATDTRKGGKGMNNAGGRAAERFCFVTPLDLQSLDDLTGELVRDRVLRMLEGYYRCFSGRIAG